jgi:uncharacterized membrane protein YqgA involved in biofilm formation
MVTAKREMDNRTSLNHNDGLVDIFVGFSILVGGLYIWADMVWMAGVFIPVFLPGWKAARQRLNRRRGGELVQDSFVQAQSQKVFLYITLLMGVLLLGGLGLFFAFAFMSGTAVEWLRSYFLLILGAIFASVWGIAALMLRANRFFLYALFTFLPLAIAQYTTLPFWAALTITGGLVLLFGLGVYLNFLQEHPIIEKGT